MLKKLIAVGFLFCVCLQMVACDKEVTSSTASKTSSQAGVVSKPGGSTVSQDATTGNVDFEVYNINLPKVPAVNVPATSSISKVIYVSADGSLTGTGTIDNPIGNLKIAIDRAAAQLASSTNGVAILVRGGTYEVTTEMKVDKLSTGLAGKPIVIDAYPGEKPVFTGAKTLPKSSFTKVTDGTVLNRIIDATAKSKLMVVDLAAAGVTDLGEITRRGFNFNNGGGTVQPMLYVGDDKQTLARWPNAGKVIYDSVVDKGVDIKTSGDAGKGPVLGVKDKITRFALWKDVSDVWADGIMTKDWSWNYNKVVKVDAEKGETFELMYGDCSGTPTMETTRGFFFENLLEEIDMPGEYYIDRTSKKLYYYPSAEFASEPIKLSHYKGRALLSFTSVENIIMKNLTFEGTRGSAISAAGCKNMVFDSLVIKNIGVNGIGISGENNRIINSHIFNIGSNAVSLSGGDAKSLKPVYNVAENNFIHDVAQVLKVYKGAFNVDGVGQVVRNNVVKNAPHMGVMVRGNDHLFAYNEFFNIMTEYRDMGIMYMNLGAAPQQRGTQVYNNYFHHYDPAAEEVKGKAANWGVYLDNGTQGFEVVNNIFANTNAGGVNMHGGGWNVVQNNIFANAQIAVKYSNLYTLDWTYTNGLSPRTYKTWKTIRDTYMQYNPETKAYSFKAKFKDTFGKYKQLEEFMAMNNKFFAIMSTIKEANRIPNEYRSSVYLAQPGNQIKNNLMYNKEIELFEDGIGKDYGFGKQDTIEIANNKMTKEDPGFKNLAGGDYTLNIKGFSQINFAAIGNTVSKIPGGASLTKLTPFNAVYPMNGATDVSPNAGKMSKTNKGSGSEIRGAMLVWDRRAGADKYKVEVSTTADFSKDVTTYETGKNELLTDELKPSTKYYWRVTAKVLAKGATGTLLNANGIQSFTTTDK